MKLRVLFVVELSEAECSNPDFQRGLTDANDPMLAVRTGAGGLKHNLLNPAYRAGLYVGQRQPFELEGADDPLAEVEALRRKLAHG